MLTRDEHGFPLARHFAGPRDVVLELCSGPDSLGRYMLRSFRLDDGRRPWNPSGVRAQTRQAVPAEYAATERAKGNTVRMIDGSEVPA